LTNAGSQFDPDCVAIFEHHLAEVTEAAEATEATEAV
jgi:HD-GYP domain-containing protein (c-di-GMP phosphodiesterase class II)